MVIRGSGPKLLPGLRSSKSCHWFTDRDLSIWWLKVEHGADAALDAPMILLYSATWYCIW